MLTLFSGEWAYWQLASKITIDGVNKLIYVNPGVTTLDIRVDFWSRYVDWQALPGNDRFLLAMRRTGLDNIPGGQTGDFYFMINGWKVIIDMNKVRVNGVLFSDDYETAYYSADLLPIYPAKVSSVVNTVTVTIPVITGTVPTPAEISTAVWGTPTTNIPGTFGELISRKMLTIAKFLGLK